MASPSHARWIAPTALLAALLAVALVYSSSTGDGGNGSPPASSTSTSETRARTPGRTSTSASRPRTTTTPAAAESYTVQTGDTLGSIAEQNGTSVAELQELNPGVDSQSLSVGQEIKLPG
jgi:LysM repeat protein